MSQHDLYPQPAEVHREGPLLRDPPPPPGWVDPLRGVRSLEDLTRRMTEEEDR